MNARRRVMVMGVLGCALVGALLTAWLFVSNIRLMPVAEPTREVENAGKTDVAEPGATVRPSVTPAALASPSATEMVATSAFSSENIEQLERSLNSPDRAGQAGALVPRLRDSEWSEPTLLPAGATVRFIPSTFQIQSEDYATVTAEVRGSVEQDFMVLLERVDGVWFILDTFEAE